MSDNANRRVEAQVVGTIWVSVFCHLVWPCLLYEFVEAKDRLVWPQERERQVVFVLNGVVVGTVRQWFVDNLLCITRMHGTSIRSLWDR